MKTLFDSECCGQTTAPPIASAAASGFIPVWLIRRSGFFFAIKNSNMVAESKTKTWPRLGLLALSDDEYFQTLVSEFVLCSCFVSVRRSACSFVCDRTFDPIGGGDRGGAGRRRYQARHRTPIAGPFVPAAMISNAGRKIEEGVFLKENLCCKQMQV